MVESNLAYNILSKEERIDECPVKWCSVTLSDIVARQKRLEASVYDIDAKQARYLIAKGKYPQTSIGGEKGLASPYVCGRFKRIWVKKSDMPIYQPSSIVDIKPTPDGYISNKTRTNINALRVKKNQILMTCSGTIGKISFVSKTLENKIFSHDLLRIDCKNQDDAGYVYTYLKSKIGNKILLTNSYGAVITHIEPEHLATVPIPDAPALLKRKIHNLIMQSFELRDASNDLIDQATSLLVKELKLPDIVDFDVSFYKKDALVDTYNVKLSKMKGRLDASYHIPIVNAIIEHLKQYSAEVTTIEDVRISKEIILPGRFKRVYVDEGYGVPFFSGRSIGELDPSDKKYLSLSQHSKKIKSDLTIQEGMILITCSGTIGKIAFVPKHWDKWAMTHDIIRLSAKKDINGYVYIWLQTEYAAKIIKSLAYGSVVHHIEKKHTSCVPVPLLKNQDVQKKINDLALEANQKRYDAYCLEQEALNILDKEIIYAEK